MRFWESPSRRDGRFRRDFAKARIGASKRRFHLEHLEERTLLSTYTISEISQSGSVGVYELIDGIGTWYPNPPSPFVVSTGSGTNTVNILNTFSPCPVYVISGGADTVNVGNAGSVQGVYGIVQLTNPSNHTTLNVDDSADTAGRAVTFSTLIGSEWGVILGLAPAAIGYKYADTHSINVTAGTGANYLNVLSTGVTTNLSARGAATVNIGDAGSVQGIRGDVNVTNPPNFTTLNIFDVYDTTARTYTLSSFTGPDSTPWGKITGLAPATIAYKYADTSRVGIGGSSNGDTVNVQGTGVSTYIEEGGDAATVNIGDAGSVQGILGVLTLENAFYYNKVNVDDSADPTGRTVTLIAGRITGLAPAAIWYTNATSSLTVYTGHGTNTVNVQGTDVSTWVMNEGGHDTVNVGNQHTLGDINSFLVVDNVSGQSQLNVDDSADSVAHTAYLEANLIPEIVGLAPATIAYANLSGLNVTTGTAADTVDVYSTYYPTTLSSGGGQDTVYVGYNGVLSYITGALTVTNPPSYTALNIDDSADTGARSATIGSGAITGLAPATISYQQIDLSALTIKGGAGGNTFTVANTPSNPANPITTLDVGNGTDTVVIQAASGLLHANGGSGLDTLVGPNAANAWHITGSDSGTVGNVTFSGIDNLTGGTGNDAFQFGPGGWVAGVVNGGGGVNTLDYSGDGGGVATVNLATAAATKTGGFANIQNLVSSSSAGDTLIGPNATNVWWITAANAGTVGSFHFSGVENLTGGTGVDEFVFSAGATNSGKIDGGTANGNDWLDYAAYTSAVTVNLAANSASGVDGGAAGGIANIRNVRGGQGVNTLTGNSQGNILTGGAGNNMINGGSGRSILIADKGTSTINGGSADDIVIGGYTSYDGSGNANDQALMAIMAEWQSSDSYSTRVSKITAGVAGGAKLVVGTTVFSNGKTNTLNGGGGSNWVLS
jgi:hypothetical protein